MEKFAPRLGEVAMGRLAPSEIGSMDSEQPRSLLQRVLDPLAEWQMRRSLWVICRGHRRRATSSSVAQPSSANQRSSAIPCDR
jgi:hypothetical protein